MQTASTAFADEELPAVVRSGATLVPKVAQLIERCVSEADPGRDLARACGQVASAYWSLRDRLADMSRTALVDEVDGLLNYQLQLLTQASALAFRPRNAQWRRVATAFGDGWGEPADQLIRLAARL